MILIIQPNVALDWDSFRDQVPKSGSQQQSGEQTLRIQLLPTALPQALLSASPPQRPKREQTGRGQRCQSECLSLQVKEFKIKEICNDCLHY